MEYGAPVDLDVLDRYLMDNFHLVWPEGRLELERPRTIGRTCVAFRADFD